LKEHTKKDSGENSGSEGHDQACTGSAQFSSGNSGAGTGQLCRAALFFRCADTKARAFPGICGPASVPDFIPGPGALLHQNSSVSAL